MGIPVISKLSLITKGIPHSGVCEVGPWGWDWRRESKQERMWERGKR